MKNNKKTKTESKTDDGGPANPNEVSNVELHMKRVKRKKLLLSLLNVVWILVIIGCVIYIGYYYYQSIHNKADSKNLASSVEQLRQDALSQKTETEVDDQKIEDKKSDNEQQETNKQEHSETDFFSKLSLEQKREITLPWIHFWYAAYSGPIAKSIYMLPQYQALYLENHDLTGWIRIPDTVIDYPVMQSSDNQYYLDKGFNRGYKRCGSIFADAEADVFLPSANVILYGHNMKDGTMFHTLISYETKEFYEEHKYILFDTVYQENTYEVVAAFYTKIYDTDSTEFKYYQFHEAADEEEFDEFITNIKRLSEYDTGITPVFGDDLITLSTCAYHTENGRFVVVARRMD